MPPPPPRSLVDQRPDPRTWSRTGDAGLPLNRAELRRDDLVGEGDLGRIVGEVSPLELDVDADLRGAIASTKQSYDKEPLITPSAAK
jgi:hypothetical protein